jgi:hypothetical protein
LESKIPSAYVYEAVVEEGVVNLAQFSEWLAGKKNKTDRSIAQHA